VFALYLAALLLFLGTGLGLFYQYQFTQNIDDELLAAEMMMGVAAQSVADSAVIGDYDTIQKTLEQCDHAVTFRQGHVYRYHWGSGRRRESVEPEDVAPTMAARDGQESPV